MKIYLYIILILYINIILSIPNNVKIGLLFPLYKKDLTLDTSGVARLASSLLAIKEINNKTDGLYDDILPFTNISFALRDSKRDQGEAFFGSLELCDEVFNNNGVVGIIGAASSTPSTSAAIVSREFDVVQISYASTSSSLSHGASYPYFFRTVPSDSYQGLALAELISYYGWSRVATFSSSDDYGSNGISEFNNAAEDLDITVLSSQVFNSGVSDLTDEINAVLTSGAKIIVLFCSAEDAATILSQSYKLGLGGSGYQFIGSDSILKDTTYNTIATYDDDDDNPLIVGDVLRGFLGLKPYPGLSHDLRKFYERYVSQDNTNGTTSGECLTDLDDDGNFYLYQQDLDQDDDEIIYSCCGVVFSDLDSNGSNIDTFVPFAYDAVIALAYAIDDAINNNGYDINNNIDGEFLRDTLIYNVTFTGITGPIDFEIGEGDDLDYQGDREVGITYSLENWNDDSYDESSDGFVQVGDWTPENGFVLCNKCEDVIFSSGTSTPPSDNLIVIVKNYSIGLKIFGYIMASISLLIILFFMGWLYYYRKTKLVRISQYQLCQLLLLGCILGSINTILSFQSPSTNICTTTTWFVHLSFTLVYGSLFLKTWRVHRILNNKALRKVIINNKLIMTYMIRLLVFVLLYLTYWTINRAPYRDYESEPSDEYDYHYEYCHEGDRIFPVGIFVLETIALFIGGYLAWLTKDVPDAFNESRYIAISIYIILLITVVSIPFRFFLNIREFDKRVVDSLTSQLTILTTAILIFAPKVYVIRGNLEVSKDFEFTSNTSSTSKNNKSEARLSGVADSLGFNLEDYQNLPRAAKLSLLREAISKFQEELQFVSNDSKSNQA